MTEKELLESIIRDSNRSEVEVKEFCKFHNITLEEYRRWLDRAIATRKKTIPSDYPKAIIKKTTS